jgi:hypothetical protein
MFIPTGWQDWELVVTALLYAWAALTVVSLFAFGVAYGLFRTPHPAGTARSSPADRMGRGSPGDKERETVTSTESLASSSWSESPAASPVSQSARELTAIG